MSTEELHTNTLRTTRMLSGILKGRGRSTQPRNLLRKTSPISRKNSQEPSSFWLKPYRLTLAKQTIKPKKLGTLLKSIPLESHDRKLVQLKALKPGFNKGLYFAAKVLDVISKKGDVPAYVCQPNVVPS